METKYYAMMESGVQVDIGTGLHAIAKWQLDDPATRRIDLLNPIEWELVRTLTVEELLEVARFPIERKIYIPHGLQAEGTQFTRLTQRVLMETRRRT